MECAWTNPSFPGSWNYYCVLIIKYYHKYLSVCSTLCYDNMSVGISVKFLCYLCGGLTLCVCVTSGQVTLCLLPVFMFTCASTIRYVPYYEYQNTPLSSSRMVLCILHSCLLSHLHFVYHCINSRVIPHWTVSLSLCPSILPWFILKLVNPPQWVSWQQ